MSIRPVVRRQDPADAPMVEALVRAAFVDEPSVAALEGALAKRADSSGYVAVADEAVVGHVRLTRGWVDAREALVEVLVLSPLAVDPAHQRRGVGRLLVEHAVREADAAGAPVVLLEGDPAYYGRLGWRPAADLGIAPPSDRIPAAACQAVALSSHEPWMRGRLVYADTFWAFDSVGLRGEALDGFSGSGVG
jgi:putative acetyltransferase